MDVIERLNREAAYNAWANRETLQSLEAAGNVPERAAAVMGHIVAAEWTWLGRLGAASPGLPVWPALVLPDCASQLRDLEEAWRAYLAGMSAQSLAREVRYTNTKGENWTNTVADVLTHVLLHSSYHRGQIATLLGRAGERAAYSDYIGWVRGGF